MWLKNILFGFLMIVMIVSISISAYSLYNGVFDNFDVVFFEKNNNQNKQITFNDFVIDKLKPETIGMVVAVPNPPEIPSPADRIKDEQIHVYQDRIVIDLKNAEWAGFTDTNSMDPVIDIEANAIEIIPKSEDEIQVGDIISYKSNYADGTIIHRVIEIGQDNYGWFCRVKGDNLASPDPGKVRFPDIERVVVGILY